MAPRIAQWGASGWRFLHAVSFAYPDEPTFEERQRMFAFLWSVGHVLPCRRCRAHYESYLQAHHLTSASATALRDRTSLSRFVVDLHNDVNRRLQRSEFDYERVRYEYEVECDAQWPYALAWAAVAVLVAAVVASKLRRRSAPGASFE